MLVVCTDVEHGEQIDPRLVELAHGADLLVHDAQYTAEELQKRRGWGHSSFDQAMQLAEMAGVKRLALTHHDPDHDDEFLERIEKLCQERFPNAVLAREGMENPDLRANLRLQVGDVSLVATASLRGSQHCRGSARPVDP